MRGLAYFLHGSILHTACIQKPKHFIVYIYIFKVIFVSNFDKDSLDLCYIFGKFVAANRRAIAELKELRYLEFVGTEKKCMGSRNRNFGFTTIVTPKPCFFHGGNRLTSKRLLI